MSVNIFKNGILSKIAGAVGDAVPLINNFLTNQEGKGAADANTVYVLNNKIDEVNSSLTTLSDTVDELTNKNNEIIKVDFPVGTSVQSYPTGCTNTNLIPIGVAIKGANEQGYFAPSDVSGTFIQTEIDGIHLTRGNYSRDMIAFLVKVS